MIGDLNRWKNGEGEGEGERKRDDTEYIVGLVEDCKVEITYASEKKINKNTGNPFFKVGFKDSEGKMFFNDYYLTEKVEKLAIRPLFIAAGLYVGDQTKGFSREEGDEFDVTSNDPKALIGKTVYMTTMAAVDKGTGELIKTKKGEQIYNIDYLKHPSNVGQKAVKKEDREDFNEAIGIKTPKTNTNAKAAEVLAKSESVPF